MKTKLLSIFFISILITFITKASPFITKWDMSKPGQSTNILIVGVGTTGIASYTWETIPAGQTGSGTYNGNFLTISGLPVGAIIRVTIDSANINKIKIIDFDRLIDVEQWGTAKWVNLHTAFQWCSNLNITATDIPDLSLATSFNSMFFGCGKLNGPQNIGSWNTTNVNDMQLMFAQDSSFNQPIGNWNTSNVQVMDGMFRGALNFNQPIGNWNTSNVKWMNEMFSGAFNFNQPIGNWNTSNVTDMHQMFNLAKNFNQPIGNWNTSNVTNMSSMFMNSANFNQPIGNWNTTNVTNMSSMFGGATSFNQPIANWNTSNVELMNYMFGGASTFNQPIGNWNTSNVELMNYMFGGASTFNQPIETWNTAKVVSMEGMFSDATNFNQPIGTWNLQSLSTGTSPLSWSLSKCGMDCENYLATLIGWDSNPNTPDSLFLGADNMKYSTSANVTRNHLINNKGWNIYGDVLIGSCWPTSISSFQKEGSLSVFPNPSSSIFTIDIPIESINNVELQVTDLVGKIICKRQLQQVNQSQVEIDFSKLGVQSGIYMLQVNANGKMYAPLKLLYSNK